MSKEPTRAELQNLLNCAKNVAEFWKKKYEGEVFARENEKSERPNRFAITCRVVRNDGTIDMVQNILPRIEDGESMNIAIHPAAVVNG